MGGGETPGRKGTGDAKDRGPCWSLSMKPTQPSSPTIVPVSRNQVWNLRTRFSFSWDKGQTGQCTGGEMNAQCQWRGAASPGWYRSAIPFLSSYYSSPKLLVPQRERGSGHVHMVRGQQALSSQQVKHIVRWQSRGTGLVVRWVSLQPWCRAEVETRGWGRDGAEMRAKRRKREDREGQQGAVPVLRD